MLKENDAVRKLLNVDIWHKAGYTGKGVNILMLDLNGKLLDHMKEYCILVDPENKMVNEAKHNTYDTQAGHEFAPGATVYVAPWSHSKEEITQWLRDNPGLIDIANVSLGSRESDDYNILKELGIITFCAVGNNYERDDNGGDFPASLNWTIAVGAYNWKDKGVYSNDVWGYSNWGTAVNCVGPSNITVLNEDGSKREYTGTSTSSPVDAFTFSCYLQWHKEQGLPRMTHAEAIAWIESDCMDLVDGEGQKVGEDNPSGKGLFCLPATIPNVPEEVIQVPETKLNHVLSTPYLKQEDAVALAAKLNAKGIKTYLVHSLQFGAFGVEQNAINQQETLLDEEGIKTYVARY